MKSREISWFSLVLTLIICVILMSVGSSFIYSKLIAPGFFEMFVNGGDKFFENGEYEKAVEEYEKALKLDRNNTDVMEQLTGLYMETGKYADAENMINMLDSKGINTSSHIMVLGQYHIRDKNFDEAVKVLDALGEYDGEIDAEMFAGMLMDLNVYNPVKAYEMLMGYTEKKGRENIEAVILKLVEGSEKEPAVSTPVPADGYYAKSFIMTSPIEPDRIGHGVYYVVSGSEEPQLFQGEYYVDKSMIISLLGFSQTDVADMISVTYTIDTTAYNQALWLLGESKTLNSNTVEGTEVGNCIEGAKAPFEEVIIETENILNTNILTISEAEAIYIKIADAYTKFQSQIIPDTDKSQLVEIINTARERYDNTVEGTRAGNQRIGSRQSLLTRIEAAEAVNADLLATQDSINTTSTTLDTAVVQFNNSVVTRVEQEVTDRGGNIGDVTVTMGWNTIDDIDLHVVAPSGEKIYYGNDTSRCGGKLQVDLQVSDYVNNPVENITWNTAPRGTYYVYIDVYSNRTQTSKPVTIQVIVDKMTVGTYTVYVNGDSNKYICSFNY